MYLIAQEDGTLSVSRELTEDTLQNCADGVVGVVRQDGRGGYEELTVDVLEAEGEDEITEYEEVWTTVR